MKTCSKCKEVKPLDEFSPHPRMSLGKQSSCKKCGRKARAVYYKKNKVEIDAKVNEYRKRYPEKVRESLLKWAYGIDNAEYDRLLKLQNGACAICKTTNPGGRGNRLHVDHCHGTKIVRGLLCSKCNVGVGYFQNSTQRLRSAADYLESKC